MEHTLHQNHITQSGRVPEPKRPCLGPMGGPHPRHLSKRRRLAGAGSGFTFTQPEPSPNASPSPSPSPQPNCAVTGTANVAIAGGGGSFNPFSLTINAGTRVTWTNTGNSRAASATSIIISWIATISTPASRFHLPSAFPARSRSKMLAAASVRPLPSQEERTRRRVQVPSRPQPLPKPFARAQPFPSPSPSPSPALHPAPALNRLAAQPPSRASRSPAAAVRLTPTRLTINARHAGDLDQCRQQPGTRARRGP